MGSAVTALFFFSVWWPTLPEVRNPTCISPLARARHVYRGWMKPTLMMVCGLWLTVALAVAVAVMAREDIGLPGLLLLTVVAFFLMGLAVRFTRGRRYGMSHPLGKEKKAADLRRKRSRRRYVGFPH